MPGNTQICKDAVCFHYAVMFTKIVYESEIGLYPGYPSVIGQVVVRIGVLVKNQQAALRSQLLQNGTGMASSAECGIYVYSPGLYGQGCDTFFQKNRYMIQTHRRQYYDRSFSASDT
jgi:Na+-translocating ferredoxin:NAD+ oxidoreductase RnfD subunit